MPATFRDIIVIMHEFSNINILIMVVGTLAGSMLILPILVHRLLRMFGISGSEHVSSGAMDASKAIAGYAALVISFCILEAQTNLHKAEDSISREASAILNLDRVLLRSEVPALVELRPALLAYGRAGGEAAAPTPAEPVAANPLDEMRRQMDEMRAQIDRLASTPRGPDKT